MTIKIKIPWETTTKAPFSYGFSILMLVYQRVNDHLIEGSSIITFPQEFPLCQLGSHAAVTMAPGSDADMLKPCHVAMAR